MRQIEREPIVAVGLMASAETVSFELKGEFADASGVRFAAGSYQAVTACSRPRSVFTRLGSLNKIVAAPRAVALPLLVSRSCS